MDLGIKDKHQLIDLVHYGSTARRHVKPSVLIGSHPIECSEFKEGDILDANATLNLIRTAAPGCGLNCKCNKTVVCQKGDPGEQGPQGEQGLPGNDGADGITPHIDSVTREWVIGDINTGVLARGTDGLNGADGITPHIDLESGHWFIGTEDTGVKAQGPQGQHGDAFTYEDFTPALLEGLKGAKGDNGTNGTDGQTPYIGMNGNWFIGNTDTGIEARGPKGDDGANGIPGTPGPKGDKGDPFQIYKSYDSISDMVADAANVPENKFVIIANESDSDNGKLYVRKLTATNRFEFIADLAVATAINGEDGVTPLLRINTTTDYWEVSYDNGSTYTSLNVKAKGSDGQRGIGIKSMSQTVTSTENGGVNTFTFTLDDNRSALFNVRNGGTADLDVYTKEEVDALIDSVKGFITVRRGEMTTVAEGTRSCPVFMSYVSMDPTTASQVTNITYTWEDVDGNLQHGGSLQYYASVTFGSTRLTNVWCTPIREISSDKVRYTAFIYDPQAAVMNKDEYNHVFLQQDEYLSLESYDNHTIYFIWDTDEQQNENWTFPGTFPITFGKSTNEFPITLT